jgi:hypothetical protein
MPRYVDPNPEPTGEQLIGRHEAIWRLLGGNGPPPPLIVSAAFHRMAIKAGFPAERMKIAPVLPAS